MGAYQHYMTPSRRIMVFNDPDFVPELGAEIIDTGDWLPALILGRLFGDTKLYVSFYDWKQAENFTPGLTKDEIYWADSGGIVHMQVISPRLNGWAAPWEALGLDISNGAKLTKRLKEIVRIARYYTSAPALVKYFLTDDSTEKFYDGISIIRRSFARKMGVPRRSRRGNFRFMASDGTIKGDAIIISDALMDKTHGDFDIVAPYVNLKSEVRTKGWTFATFNPYHAHNHAMFDVQSASWLREWLYPREQIKETFTTVVDSVFDELAAGNWPSWMILPEAKAHEEGAGALPQTDENASDAFNRQYLKWQMFGMKVEHSASIMGMAFNAFGSRLSSKLNYSAPDSTGEMRWKPKMWLPLPHAVYGHILTHEVLELAGYTIPERAKDKLFYHEETESFSLPGVQFADTFEAHGTWDLDDTAKFFLRKVKGTDRVVCVIVRSPNSDGEYSIHEVYTDGFPLYHQYGEMPEIDLEKAPARIEHVMLNQTVAGLPANPHVIPALFTEDEAKYSIKVQKKNPGIGYLANAMMVHYASLGMSPAEVLATMGDMVDLTQQTPYLEGFVALTEFTEEIWEQIAAYGRVDAYMARTRVPWSISKEMVKYDGYFESIFRHFQKETKRFLTESKPASFRIRRDHPIDSIMTREFTPEVKELAIKWVTAAERNFAEVATTHKGSTIVAKKARSAANRAIISRMVVALSAMEEEAANELMLAMYRFCCIPGVDGYHRYGISDRCLFGPTDEGDTSTMDLFLRALVSIGEATRPAGM